MARILKACAFAAAFATAVADSSCASGDSESCDSEVSLLQSRIDHREAQAPGLNVVVVGAGLSGLTAARTIIDNWNPAKGTLNLQVLEASDHVGGRTFTNYDVPGWGSIAGAEADMGASWIHQFNPTTHPIGAIATKLNLDLLKTSDGSKSSFSRCVFNAVPPATNKCEYDVGTGNQRFKNATKVAKTTVSRGADKSLWDAIGAVNGSAQDDPLMQFNLVYNSEFEYGASVTKLSAFWYGKDNSIPDAGPEMLIKQGYSAVVAALQKGSITLSNPCKSNTMPDVTLSSTAPAVNVILGKQVSQISSDSAQNKIIVTTQDGTAFPADNVVVTVPIGVLKKSAIKFSTALSQKKQDAIDKLNFGDVVKVGLLFDSFWWPDRSKIYFGLIKQNSSGLDGVTDDEQFTWFLNTDAAGSGRPILMSFAFGGSAVPVEQWSDAQVWDKIRTNLVSFFSAYDGPGGPVQVPTAMPKMWRSSWASNNLFGGAYTSIAPGSSPAMLDALAEYVAYLPGKYLHFAGEHTNSDWFGTAHGAFWSGQRAACEVLKPELL